jgi:hypothetical protein
MKFRDVFYSREERYSLGVEEEYGKYYLSIPVSNRCGDYEEYYEIDKASFDQYLSSPASVMPFLDQCRRRKKDHLLILKPGSDRGTSGYD